MTDDPRTDEGSTTSPQDSQADSIASEAWKNVVVRMGEFGTAVAAWARTAADDPENRERLEQLQRGVDDVARKAESSFTHLKESGVGQSAEQAAQAIGDAVVEVSKTAAPYVASAFSGLAEAFGRAAAKMEESSKKTQAEGAEGEPPATASGTTSQPGPGDTD